MSQANSTSALIPRKRMKPGPKNPSGLAAIMMPPVTGRRKSQRGSPVKRWKTTPQQIRLVSSSGNPRSANAKRSSQPG